MGDLTSDARVREYVGATAGEFDSLMIEIVAGVSARMENHMGRTIELTTYTNEIYLSTGMDSVVLQNGPVLTADISEVIEGATTLTTADWRLEGLSLVRLFSAVRSVWARADIDVTYKAGFKNVPPSLRLAATEQCAHEWHKTKPGGNRLGLSGKDEAGGTSSYIDNESEFLQSVLFAMEPFLKELA